MSISLHHTYTHTHTHAPSKSTLFPPNHTDHTVNAYSLDHRISVRIQLWQHQHCRGPSLFSFPKPYWEVPHRTVSGLKMKPFDFFPLVKLFWKLFTYFKNMHKIYTIVQFNNDETNSCVTPLMSEKNSVSIWGVPGQNFPITALSLTSVQKKLYKDIRGQFLLPARIPFLAILTVAHPSGVLGIWAHAMLPCEYFHWVLHLKHCFSLQCILVTYLY